MPPRLFRLACMALALALPLGLAPAQAQADCRNAGGNDALAIACLQAALDQDRASASDQRSLDRRLRELGLEGIGLDQTVPHFETRWQLRPRLRESSGNLLGDNAEAEAGATIGWRLRATPAEGQRLTARITAFEAVEPVTMDRRAGRDLTLCSNTALTATTHLDLCNTLASRLKRGDTNWENSAELSLNYARTQSADRALAYHIGLERLDDLDQGFFQPRLHLGAALLDRQAGLTGLDLSLGAPVSGHHLMQWRIDGLHRWHPFALRSHVLRKSGRDRTTLELGSSVSVKAPYGFDLSLGLRARHSSVEEEWRLTPVFSADVSF